MTEKRDEHFSVFFQIDALESNFRDLVAEVRGTHSRGTSRAHSLERRPTTPRGGRGTPSMSRNNSGGVKRDYRHAQESQDREIALSMLRNGEDSDDEEVES